MTRASRARSGLGAAVWAWGLACALGLGRGAWAAGLEPQVAAATQAKAPQAPSPQAPSPQATAPAEPAEAPWVPRWGFMVEVGLPDGLGLAGLWRPLRWVRVHGGATLNTFGHGVRAGASLTPLELAVSPLLDVDVGYALRADLDTLLLRLGGQPRNTEGPRETGYSYASAGLGLEWALSEHVALYGRLGLSAWYLRLTPAQALLQGPEGSELTARSLSMWLTVPSGKLALVVSF